MAKIKIFALGGLGENGKNMYVVEVNQHIFIVFTNELLCFIFILGYFLIGKSK